MQYLILYILTCTMHILEVRGALLYMAARYAWFFISTCQWHYLVVLSAVVSNLLSQKELFSDYSILSWLQKLFSIASFIWLNWVCLQVHCLAKELTEQCVSSEKWSKWILTKLKKMRLYVKVLKVFSPGAKNPHSVELPIFGES